MKRAEPVRRRSRGRRIILSPAAIRAGALTLPRGVTWLLLPGMPAPIGQFPHARCCADDDPLACHETLRITLGGHKSEDRIDLWCSRERGHNGQHVCHIATGTPVAAWLEDGAR